MNDIINIIQEYKNYIEKIPEEMLKKPKVIIEYKQYLLVCFQKKINKRLIYKEYEDIFKISQATIKRILSKSGKRYQEIWENIKKYNFCEDPTFENFIKIKLNSLSKWTIAKNKIYYDYFKKFNNGEIISRRPSGKIFVKEKKPIKEKRDYEIKTKKNKINRFNSIVNFMKTKRKLRKINILATTKSSKTIKKLARSFNCEIQEISNRIDRDELLEYFN